MVQATTAQQIGQSLYPKTRSKTSENDGSTRCHLPEKQRLPNLRHVYPTSYLHAHQYKNNGKVHLLTSKLHTKECPSQKIKEAPSYSNSRTRPTHTDQHTLAPKPVPGSGERCLVHYSGSFTNFCASDTLLGSMWTTFFSYSPIQQRLFNLLSQSFFSGSLVHLFLRKNWSSAAPLNGMDGPSARQQVSQPSKPRRYVILFPAYNHNLAEGTLRKSLVFSFGQPPLSITLDSYSPPFTATPLEFLQPITAFAQHFGNMSWIFSTTTPSYPDTMAYTSQ